MTVGMVLELAFTLRGSAALVPPPGAGFVTDTWTVPAASAEDGTVTVMDVSVDRVGESRDAPTFTTEVQLKLFPLSTKVGGPLPAVYSVGVMLMRTGAAFCARRRIRWR